MSRPSDNLTLEGANRLARVIANYWAWHGHRVAVTVEPITDRQHTVYCVRSDMVNGLPQEKTPGVSPGLVNSNATRE